MQEAVRNSAGKFPSRMRMHFYTLLFGIYLLFLSFAHVVRGIAEIEWQIKLMLLLEN